MTNKVAVSMKLSMKTKFSQVRTLALICSVYGTLVSQKEVRVPVTKHKYGGYFRAGGTTVLRQI